MTVPEAGAFGLAFGSASASATNRTVSSKSSSPSPVWAETLTNSWVPPNPTG